MSELPKLPAIRNKVRHEYIDATPKGYALRILKYYREKCNEKWEAHGLDLKIATIHDAMNAYQDERAKELDKAIDILERYSWVLD